MTNSSPGLPPTQLPQRPQRPQRPQSLLTVTRKEMVSPHLVRVYFSGAPQEHYEAKDDSATDRYMKLFFAAPGQKLVAPVDLEALREQYGQDALPTRRTYSLRSYDSATKEATIEFVVHGDEGIAGPWAAHAQPGDQIVATAPHGAYAPATDADWHLLVGDESAVPAIASALESLSADARGITIIEADGQNDVFALSAPEGVEVRWVLRNGDQAGAVHLIVDELNSMTWPAGDVHVFAHGEREQIKIMRGIFRERGIERSRLSISGYWAYGRAEDQFQAEKRDPIGKID